MMTPRHFRWPEFRQRLEGPDGCNFRHNDKGEINWDCGGGRDKSRATAILKAMGFSEAAIEKSLAYFEAHGGYCDCEILFNVGGK